MIQSEENLDQWLVLWQELKSGEMTVHYLGLLLDDMESAMGLKKDESRGQLLAHTRVLH